MESWSGVLEWSGVKIGVKIGVKFGVKIGVKFGVAVGFFFWPRFEKWGHTVFALSVFLSVNILYCYSLSGHNRPFSH